MNGTPQPPSPRVPWLSGIVRALVGLLPGWLRREWGDDLLATAEARLADAAVHGRRALLAAFAAELVSLGRVIGSARWYLPEFRQGRGVMFEEDNRPLRAAWIAALVVHFLAFTAIIPIGPSRVDATPEKTYTVIARYEPPPPPPEEPERRVVKRDITPVPIPDPTPDAPEPFVSEDYVYADTAGEAADVDFIIVAPSGPPVPDQEVYRVGAEVQRPQLLDKIVPDYPELALRARLECVVIMEARIDKQGNVVDLAVLRPCGLGLTESALNAVRKWKYAPTMVNGRPVEVVLTATVVFQLTHS